MSNENKPANNKTDTGTGERRWWRGKGPKDSNRGNWHLTDGNGVSIIGCLIDTIVGPDRELKKKKTGAQIMPLFGQWHPMVP